MSRYYVGNNNEGAKKLFNKRAYYNETVVSEYDSLTRFIAEKYYYGRVDRNFSPIHLSDPYTNLKQFTRTPVSRNGMRAINFVVDAFNDMSRQFDKCSQLGRIDPNDQYLSKLKVYRAYESSNERYEKYMPLFNSAMANNAANKKFNIDSFDTFSSFLLETVKETPVTSPCTLPAYVKNRRTPPTISGLVIEIADLNKSIDDIKIAGFVNSKNWEFFLNTARTFGFMIDRNIPWRLVADIGSSAMLEYASRYGSNTTDDVLSNYYINTGFSYLTQFPRRMYDMYNAVKPERIEFTETCNDREVSRVRYPRRYGSFDNFIKTIGIDKINELYCNIRFLEEEKDKSFTSIEKKKLILDFNALYHAYGKAEAAKQFEFIINKPFDYTGSMTYNINAQRSREEIERQQQETVSTGAPDPVVSPTTSTSTTTGY
jgi:hypothetical protein